MFRSNPYIILPIPARPLVTCSRIALSSKTGVCSTFWARSTRLFCERLNAKCRIPNVQARSAEIYRNLELRKSGNQTTDARPVLVFPEFLISRFWVRRRKPRRRDLRKPNRAWPRRPKLGLFSATICPIQKVTPKAENYFIYLQLSA